MKQSNKNKYTIMDDKGTPCLYGMSNSPEGRIKKNKVLNYYESDNAARKTPYFKQLLKTGSRHKQFKILSRRC